MREDRRGIDVRGSVGDGMGKEVGRKGSVERKGGWKIVNWKVGESEVLLTSTDLLLEVKFKYGYLDTFTTDALIFSFN